MKLTEHFTLNEFQRSATASYQGIDNNIPSKFISSIRNLCEQVLEPLRQHVQEPVIIGSGYRSPALNAIVGGVANSQHMKGEAADIHCPNRQKLHDWFLWLMDNTNFDQLLLEKSKTSTWIHVSCKPDISKNRHMVRRIIVTK